MTTEPLLGLTNITGASNFTTTVDPNPWSGPMGPQQYFEVFYLSIVVVLGCFGNLTVIFSIVVENRVHAHGNAFVINLAVADLLVTGFVMPTVIANVVAGGNALPDVACKVAGYTVTVTCTCSVANLMLIAINRYWAVVHSKTYARNFTKKRVYMMVIGCWTWCNLVAMPTLLGWGSIDYDMKMMVCSWNDMISISYTIFLAVCAIFVPLVVIAFCYWKLFSTVRSSGRWVRSLSSGSGILQNSEQNRRSERKERNLLQTLATTVAVFCVCWLPYATTCIVDPRGIPAPAKKAFGWLGLSNSAVNFVIYGAMNPVFRRGYRNLFFLIFTCKRAKKISSAGLHASQHSDSFYKSKRRSSAPSTPNSRLAVTKPSPLLVTIGRRSLPQNFLADTRSSIAATPQMTPKSSNNNGNLQFNRRPTSTNIDTPKHFGRGSDAQTRQNSEEPPPAPSHPSQSPKYKSGKAGPASVAAFRRPHSLLRREKRPAQVDKKVAELEREARLKRNSLMLLQIQMSDDEDEGSPVVHRRTRSEIPNGTLKRLIQPPSSNSMNNLSGDAFLDTPTATKCSTESDMSHDEKSPKQDATPQNDSMQIEVPVVRRESAV